MPSLIACRYIFRLEAAECEAEGVACPRLTFADNSAVMTLMTSKPTGVFSLMNEGVLIKTRTLTRSRTLFYAEAQGRVLAQVLVPPDGPLMASLIAC